MNTKQEMIQHLVNIMSTQDLLDELSLNELHFDGFVDGRLFELKQPAADNYQESIVIDYISVYADDADITELYQENTK